MSAAPSDLAGRVLVKADHALPLAGSIKARGGLYAVLCIAERIARAARRAAEGDASAHVIDDERSADLFYGHSAAATQLAEQLADRGITVGASRPLCLYLPCGVGGAPAGVLYGLRSVRGAHVWGFFAEPTASPCMLLRLLGAPATATVHDLGLDNRTIADGPAVGRASDFAFERSGDQVMGAFTVSDAERLDWIALASSTEGLRLEPSAATGLAGALDRVWRHPACPDLKARLCAGTHVVWTTGGALLPEAEFRDLLALAR